MAHIVYALSPGGVEASVARTTRWRRMVERAVAGTRLDADDVEAMLFLESAGRPTVMADGTPNSATGLMQIIPSTAVALLGMRVDLARSLEINRRAAARAAAGRARGEGEEAARCAAAGARAPAGAEGRGRAVRPAEGDRRFRSLPVGGAAALRARRPRDRLVPHGHRQPADAHRHVHLAAPPRPQHAADGRALRPVVAADLLRLVPDPQPAHVGTAHRPRRRLAPLPVQGARLAGDPEAGA